jgi:aryl carrier-like protein
MKFCYFVGEPCSVKLVNLILIDPIQNFILWNWYGLTETTVVCTFYPVNITTNMETIPIGRPFPNYQYNILDEFMQGVPMRQEGELLIGGVGVFAGYHGSDDLTAKALVEIDGELFYRTGDLVRMDENGIIHYNGRKDFQIKLHGQRIELGEIERCLLDTSISACVVMKWGEDHLIAYVQSSNINENELRVHCQSHLPPHMIPSTFMILDKLPLNANGKVDRKLLPSPDFSQLSSTNIKTDVEHRSPTNEIEVIIHQMWCDIFQKNQISIDTSIFTIGGHSLVVMRLFHRYKTKYHLHTKSLSIADLFQHPTIAGHAQLIYRDIDNIENIDNYHWSSLHLIQGL